MAAVSGMRRGLALLRLVLTGQERRLGLLVLLAAFGALVEGAGLLLLLAVFRALGLAESGRLGLPRLIEGDLGTAVMLYLALAGGSAAVLWQRSRLTTRFRLRTVQDLRIRLYDTLWALPWQQLQALSASNVTQLLGQDVQRVGIGGDFLVRTVGWLVQIPVLMLVAVGLSPLLTLGVVLTGGGVASVMVLLDRAQRRTADQVFTRNRALHQCVSDDLAGRRLIRTHGIEAARQECLAALDRTTAEAIQRQSDLLATQQALLALLVAGGAALGLVIAVEGLGVALAEALVLTLTYARLGMMGLRLRDCWRMVEAALPAYGAVAEMLALCQYRRPDSGSPPQGGLRFEGLILPVPEAGSFAPLTAVIPPGSFTVICGPSGIGKSTLLEVILGLIPPAGGRISDGAGQSPTESPGWLSGFAYGAQDAFIFSGSLRAALGSPPPEDAACHTVLAEVGLTVRFAGHPAGLAQPVSPDSLSGGERQRLSVARALLRPAPILLLDEPASALDEAAEARLMAALKARCPRQTIILISHRPAVQALADQVITLGVDMQQGRCP